MANQNDIDITRAVEAILRALLEDPRPHMRPVELMVVGCSTSEIAGAIIGKRPDPALGELVARAVEGALKPLGVSWAAQCCEHLNRALVMEGREARRLGYDQACVVPFPRAGGSFASAAYRLFEQPVVVEHIRADAGLDIGDTLIGMHLRDVAVPVRPPIIDIGHAHVTMARTRPRLIGGERAMYTL